jgi:hypothetical protein
MFLARDPGRGMLIVVRATPVPGQRGEFEIDVARELPDEMPFCKKCGHRLRPNSRFCSNCREEAPQEKWPSSDLRDAAQERADERELEIRDEMRVARGRMYFAIHRRTGALQALLLEEVSGGDFALSRSDYLQTLLARVSDRKSTPTS